MFIFAIVLGILGLLALGVSFFLPKTYTRPGYGSAVHNSPAPLITKGVAGLLIVGSLAFGIPSTFYTQDPGEAKVLKDWSGKVIGSDITEGATGKAPWVETVDFDIRNQQAIYKGNGSATSEGETVNGPEITFQDKDKVTANADVAIRYSIDAKKVEDIYRDYGSQLGLTSRLIDQDMRSVVRNTFSKYTTAQARELRTEIEAKIAEDLTARWEGTGVLVNGVALQGVRYPEETEQGFIKAQQSVTNLKTAEADLAVRKAEGESRIASAKAEAKANEILSKSITDKLLQKQYTEALIEIGNKGNLVVVPEGSSPLIQTSKSAEVAK